MPDLKLINTLQKRKLEAIIPHSTHLSIGQSTELNKFLTIVIQTIADMANTIKVKEQLVILKTQDDWDKWIEQLEGMVTPTLWTKFIDPDSTNPPAIPTLDMEEPIESAYSATYTTAVSRAEEEQVEPPEYNRVQYNLTNKEREEFRFDLEIFTRKDLPKFKAEEREYMEAAQVIRQTCDDTAKLYLKAKDPLRTQVQKLRDVYRGDPALRKRRAREAYNTAIRTPVTAKTITSWVSKWQEAMLQAEAVDLPHALDYEQWSSDLLAAVGDLVPSTVTRILQTTAGNGDLKTYRDVVQAIQSEYSIRHSVRPAQSGARRGAFVSVAAEAESEGPDQSKDLPSRPQTKAGGNETKRHRSGTVGGCWGCGLKGHTLEGCFFAEPKKRSEEWKPLEFRRSIWLRNKKTERVIRELKRLGMPMPPDD
ncbi:uncharacterized protein PV09_09546 [Verruconis gallopava]|uniref:Uncharacterized protein n=1 Tax=Verruconis gallopava TaxID=253628 RepID=A0A0D1ZX82_9PEZI|nr:uncharacterized protein PV09_09546 [Verruconis gallopava]KIV98664.1 hypothetical protein PV09_09546 [Verruconis gallopava]